MSLITYVYIAAGLWFVQQVNDIFNAFLNRKNVPKLYWLSAAASLVSGALMFYFLVAQFEAIGNVVMFLVQAINSGQRS